MDARHVDGYTLMGRAGAAALAGLRERWPRARHLRIWCGAGNNAGDGYVIARLAAASGLAVSVIAVGPPDRLHGAAARARDDWHAAGGSVRSADHTLDGADDAGVDVEVDALLGTGLDRALSGDHARAVARMNDSPAPCLAVDVPSGLHADTGAVLGNAVRADLTVTFIALKIGLFLGPARDYVGHLEFAPLVDGPAPAGAPAPVARRLGAASLAAWLPPRARDSHKGRHGRVLIVGGGRGMPGAARLAAEAALRAGAGLVTVATRPEHVTAIVAARPEIICHGIDADREGLSMLAGLADAADVVAVGPGLGRDDWAQRVWARAVAADRPMVLDADALNLLAARPSRGDQRILTPHPGEAARLLERDVSQVQADRPAALAALLERYGGVAVLKGAGSLVGNRTSLPWVCDEGNPGLASAGTGDVLTGMIAALRAVIADPLDAAACGVLLHARAGDLVAGDAGERGLLAGDLMPAIRALVNHRC